MSYGYNPDGQVTSQNTTGLAGASSSTYSYDEAGRLTSWNNGTTTTQYGYDGDGNLTRDGSKTYSYDARDELTSDGTSSYTYTARGTPSSESSPAGSVQVTFDAYGDQATAGTGSYTYDALGRLTASQPAGSGTSYAFSYAGKTSAIASDGTATYTWDPSGSTLVGTGAAGGGSGILAFTDAHGDVLGQFAPAATRMTESQAYDPWGTVTAGSLTGLVGFQGAWTDTGTGKDLMGARWYDPGAGDFTSADSVQVPPVPDPAAGNPYAYAADDPLSGTDPTGHYPLLMLPDGGSYYRTAPPPARPVASPPPPYSPWQIVRAITATPHRQVPADAHKPKPSPRAVPAPSALDPCSGNITACLAGYIRYHGGQLNRQGIDTLTGYHPGPANPGTCGTKVCYNIFTGRALKPSVIPVSARGRTASTGDAGRGAEAPSAGILPSRAQSAYTQFWETHQNQLSELYGTVGYAETALKALELFCASNLSLCGTSLFERIWAANTGQVPSTAFAAMSAPGARAGLSLAGLTCGGMSFSPSTRVLTVGRKLVAISKLKPGERVLAAGTEGKSTATATISMVLIHFDTDRYDLKVRAGQSTAVITTTADHLFWDETERRWVQAAALHAGDRLQSADGQSIVVAGGHLANRRSGWMWDLTVPGDHDFYVAAAGTAILVHNAGGPGCSIVSSPDAPPITSKTLRGNLGPKGQWRVDIENPNPGAGSASMHFQMGGEGSPKWYYNWETGEWVDEEGNVLAGRIAAQIPQNVVGRALQYFGLDANPLDSGIPPLEEEP